MLAIVGDLHGNVPAIRDIDERISKNSEVTAVIQVGDWGWYSFTIERFKRLNLKLPWYWIDGNHEDHRLLSNFTEVTEIFPNQFFVPRGTVLELDGRKIAFMGGSGSVDKEFNADWSSGEDISKEDISRLDNVKDIDLFITHCPPQWFIQKHFNPMDLLMFGLSITWKDRNADIIESLSKKLNDPKLYCGHMHRSIEDGNVKLLDIEEIVYI